MTKSIGRYQVESEIGRGGFGRVYRAYDPTVGRMVAIKTLTTSEEPGMLNRFRSEAAATGKLAHPNIVTIYDFGEHDGSPFLVMELLEGRDLDRILASGWNLTLLRTLDIMLQAASGLQHAHSKGIVHRDIKPANIMLLADGGVKIMDFGIALVTQATNTRLTPQGSVIGTMPYMAPEQFAGSVSDVLTDVFAFGITFYTILTGKHPFYAKDIAALMSNIVNKPPAPLRSFRSDLPPAVEPIVGRLLAKDRDERYQSLEDMHFDLEPIVLSLRKESAGQLFAEAQNLLAADDVEKAHSVVRQMIEIDPGNRTARELRERLQRQIKQRSVKPRVDALLEAGREHLSARHFDSAIQKFESALRLDESNPDLRTLIESTRSALERAERADGLFEAARQALGRQDLTSAHLNLTEALAADSQHHEAQALLDTVRAKMDSRRREQRLRDGVSQIKKLVLLHSFDEAIQTGSGLAEEYPQSKEVEQLLERAHHEREAHLRQERCLAGIDAAKELLRNHRFAEGAQRISQLLQEFPDSPELRGLAAYAEEELQSEKLDRLVARATEDTQRRVAAGDFDTAIDRLKRILIEYPGLMPLLSLLQSVTSQKAEAQRREAAVRKLVLEAQELLDAGKAGEAIEVLRQGAMQYPGDARVIDLLVVSESSYARRPEAEADSTSDPIPETSPDPIPETSPLVAEEPTEEPSAEPAQSRRRPKCVLVLTVCAGVAAMVVSVSFVTHWSSRKPGADRPAVRTLPPEPHPPMPEPPAPKEAASTGTLVIQAGVSDAVVYIDDEPRGHTDQTGSFSMVLELKEYQVRVERNGYRKIPPQTVNVAAGPPHVAAFPLTPDAAKADVKAMPPPPKAELIEQQDWERVRGTSDVSRIRDYLRSHPNGSHVKDAESRVADLIWSGVDQKDVDAVGRFVRENPGNPHSADAQKILDQHNAEQQRLALERSQIEQARQERLKQDLQQQNQPQSKPVPNTTVPNNPLQNTPARPIENDLRRQQVISTMAQFDMALQRRRTRDLKVIWPDPSPAFLDALGSSQVKMSLTSKTEEIQFPGGSDRAQVQCDLTTVTRGAITHQKATVTLRNTRNTWTVESLKFN